MIVRPEADEDVLETRTWYEERREGLGATFASRVAHAIEQIGRMPELFGEVAPGIRAAPIRRHRHVVFYRILSDRIDVLAVLHGARHADEWKKRV